MTPVRISAPSRLNTVAALVATTAALLIRAWLQLALEDAGIERLLASDLSYLAVPPILLLLLFPVLQKDRQFLRTTLSFEGITWQLLLTATAIGLLFRIAWWSQVTARISFGMLRNTDPQAIEGPSFFYQCPAPTLVLLGILVGAVLIPLIEEVIHRGYVQTLLHHRGPVLSVVISTALFTVFHRPSGWPFAFTAGLILGGMYWVSGSLWPSIVTHSIINLTPQLTWRCMSLQWNPKPDDLPLINPGVPAAVMFFLSSGLLVWLALAKCRRQDT